MYQPTSEYEDSPNSWNWDVRVTPHTPRCDDGSTTTITFGPTAKERQLQSRIEVLERLLERYENNYDRRETEYHIREDIKEIRGICDGATIDELREVCDQLDKIIMNHTVRYDDHDEW